MDTSVLYASGFRPPTYIRRPERFDTTLALPPGAAAIAFTLVYPTQRRPQVGLGNAPFIAAERNNRVACLPRPVLSVVPLTHETLKRKGAP